MQRPHSIDPQIFLEILHLSGCKLGPASKSLQAVHNPEGAGFWAIVAMGENLTTSTMEAHLRNLNISQETFLKWFDHYSKPFRS